MDLVVDHTRNQMQPGRVDDFVSGRLNRSVDSSDFLIFDQDMETDSMPVGNTTEAFLMSVFMGAEKSWIGA